jgi:hypothetical protein
MAVGTPGYMPPEQLEGQHVDARTDVFAFGVVAWELATGAHPFGASAAELLARMTDMLDGRTLTATESLIPVPGLESVLRRCLRRNPSDRFASAAELVSELERIQAGMLDAPAPANGGDERRSLWWWQFHQGLMAGVIAAMPVASWFVKQSNPGVGSYLFLAVLALSTISVTIRLNLLFTSRVHREQLLKQRARVYKGLAAVEAVLGLLLLGGAAAVAGPHDALAAVLVTLAVATLASLGIIEPATADAAFGSDAAEVTRQV